MLNRIIEFFNKCDSQSLKDSLDELDEEIRNIFRERGSEIDRFIINVIKDRDADFYVWFCFLKANFLRGNVIVSNRKFKSFCSEVQPYDYYYVKFPEGKLCPHLNWRFAGSLEMVLQDIKEKFRSGKEFVNKIKEITKSYDDPLLRYFELIRFLNGFKGISNKIANAVLSELSGEIFSLEKYEKHNTVNRLLKEKWLYNLFLSSFFNIMIDSHVRKFFKEKLNLKNADQIALILIGKHVRKEIIAELFERQFYWINEEYRRRILEKYSEFVGANLIEKVIWMVYFVKKNLRKKKTLEEFKFFKLSNNPFI